MNAAQAILQRRISQLCKMCKEKFIINIDDVWCYPDFRKIKDVCRNCYKYLLKCDSSSNSDVTLVNTILCRSCLPVNMRYDCKEQYGKCSCETDSRCSCCRICKNTFSYKSGDIVSQGDRCHICNHHLIHIYNDIISDHSLRDLHIRVSHN